ncbi:flagellar basal-body MS-ring/collar protein FliF [Nitrosophilus labii]|uniref:flagellar basal-body MS-ring/collar protein FliF n=1 Tax=Nitrosophilus labii TaxID=2706014 RepID=UPI0016570440|nr:flagellar basal-body MS-ring/collar protein FliF [Nitrosophilus labii]
MAFDIKNITQKLSESFKDEKFLKRVFIGLGITSIVVLLSIVFLKNINQEEYGVLYTHLNPEDAGSILTILQEERIPYKVEGEGTIILVPKNKIYDVRLKLAAKGLPSSKVVGFEIFEEPKMGATHFQENVNYLRAIEGELTRTIQKIDAVSSAKVNIALPQSSIFARDEDEAKASVIVKLRPGRDLTSEQVKAIVFLVSHAVSKLKPENVTVVDNRGRVLSDILTEEKNEKILDAVDLKKKIERDIEKRIQSMLAKAIGPQKVVVRATAEIESAKIREQEELYDPDRVAVVSERKIQEKEKGFSQKQIGAPGTPTNVPPVINTNQNNLTLDKSKKDVTTNYNISKSLIDTQRNMFKIKKLSVGVLIDGKYITKKDSNGTETKVFVPRSKEELTSYEELIKSAVGFDPKRGDKITVVSVPFEAPLVMEDENQDISKKDMTLLLAVGGLALVLLVLLIVFIIKASKAKKEAKIAQEKAALEETFKEMSKVREEENLLLDLESEPSYQKILQMIDENPELIASMISKWMKEEI